MDKEFISKVSLNKKNNQLSITLPRKKLGINKREVPKKLKIKVFEWMD